MLGFACNTETETGSLKHLNLDWHLLQQQQEVGLRWSVRSSRRKLGCRGQDCAVGGWGYHEIWMTGLYMNIKKKKKKKK